MAIRFCQLRELSLSEAKVCAFSHLLYQPQVTGDHSTNTLQRVSGTFHTHGCITLSLHHMESQRGFEHMDVLDHKRQVLP